jgi:predicted DNA-binding protein
MMKKHTSYRISEEGKQLLKLLSQRLGLNETAVIEMAIRKLSRDEEMIISSSNQVNPGQSAQNKTV